MDLNDRREQHWQESVTQKCSDLLYVMDPDEALQPSYQRMLTRAIDVLNAELDRVDRESEREWKS